MELKIAQIGNSRGVRLPARVLRKYRMGGAVVMEERSDGIFLRPSGPTAEKLGWEDTAREMAARDEDWAAWDAVSADGLESAPWAENRPARVAEGRVRYHARRRRGKSQ